MQLFSFDFFHWKCRFSIFPITIKFKWSLHSTIPIFNSIFKASNINIISNNQLSTPLINIIRKIANIFLIPNNKLTISLFNSTAIFSFISLKAIYIEPIFIIFSIQNITNIYTFRLLIFILIFCCFESYLFALKILCVWAFSKR